MRNKAKPPALRAVLEARARAKEASRRGDEARRKSQARSGGRLAMPTVEQHKSVSRASVALMSRAVEAEGAGRWWAVAAAVLHHACGSATLPALAALHAWSAALACARGAVPAARYESAARDDERRPGMPRLACAPPSPLSACRPHSTTHTPHLVTPTRHACVLPCRTSHHPRPRRALPPPSPLSVPSTPSPAMADSQSQPDVKPEIPAAAPPPATAESKEETATAILRQKKCEWVEERLTGPEIAQPVCRAAAREGSRCAAAAQNASADSLCSAQPPLRR
jgi:hypothetical protein